MTQEFWDSQYKFSVVIPDFAEALARMATDSQSFADGRAFGAAAYGDDPRQWVEWTKGQGNENILPVIIHGGYWRALRAEDHRFMIKGFLPFGAQVANVEYRLMPDVRLGDVVGDVVGGLKKLSDTFPEAKLILIGHSAGAHLALRALEAAAVAERVLGALAISGVYDLAPLPHSFLQAELQLTENEIAQHSIRPSKTRKPVLYVNGTAETYEFLRGAALMAGQGGAAQHLIQGADHMSLTWAACAEAPDLIKKLYELETA